MHYSNGELTHNKEMEAWRGGHNSASSCEAWQMEKYKKTNGYKLSVLLGGDSAIGPLESSSQHPVAELPLSPETKENAHKSIPQGQRALMYSFLTLVDFKYSMYQGMSPKSHQTWFHDKHMASSPHITTHLTTMSPWWALQLFSGKGMLLCCFCGLTAFFSSSKYSEGHTHVENCPHLTLT